jgi:hypothetical protein
MLYARPIVALAWLYGPKVPIPEFIPISSRIGPLTSATVANDVVELERPVMPLAIAARMTGRYSGRAPAMTALTATFSTVNSQNSRNAVGRRRPTTSSHPRLVPASIASTRSWVGSTIGRKSVQRSATNSRWRFSSVSGSSSAGAERSKDMPARSSSSSGFVRPSTTSCMNAPPLTGSSPSM